MEKKVIDIQGATGHSGFADGHPSGDTEVS
jgi:hypothetical protein